MEHQSLVLIFCGKFVCLPASGKTTLAHNLRDHITSTTNRKVKLISYDDVIPEWRSPNGGDRAEDFKISRSKALQVVQDVLKSVSDQSVVMVDDNNYYISMRYEIYQIARNYGIPYVIIHADCSKEECLSRNSKRAVNDRVPDLIIETMSAKFQKPNLMSNSWEQFTVIADAATSLDLAALWRQIDDSGSSSLVWLQIKEERELPSKEIHSISLKERLNLELSKAVNVIMKSLAGKRTPQELAIMAKTISEAKRNTFRNAIIDNEDQIADIVSSFVESVAFITSWLETPTDNSWQVNSRLGRNLSGVHYAQQIPHIANSTGNDTSSWVGPQVFKTQCSNLLFLTLYPVQGLDKIVDSELQFLANQMYAYNQAGIKVLIRFAPEMNGNWFIWGQQPAAYKAAFRAIYYAVNNVTSDVAFVWSPNLQGGYPYPGGTYPLPTAGSADFKTLDTNNDGNITGLDDPYTPYYPGDDVVDWVGMSIYYFGHVWPWTVNLVPYPGQFIDNLLYGGNPPPLAAGIGSYNFYSMFVTSNRSKPFAVSEFGASFHENGTYPAGYVSVAPGPGEVAIKQNWWRQSMLNTSFYAQFPKVKLFGLFEFRKFEETTFRDFQITNTSAGNNVTAALLADMDLMPSGMILYATPTSYPAVTDTGTLALKWYPSAATHTINNGISWLSLLLIIAMILYI
ncbi:mannan endo-1,4-beta-mannosidase [Synchytrium microbalum]|uniref:Mannan endo-1,4-beta-mannosidase n=1 Tax=Synchytrium microbalum TaxID=1806994 RepID=A0A507C828_9FUNG|nr:mannan endo-1,4-beta-mannosidase [Synchytrium microbalum]TPX37207.1 mannan endo-1,4-beta-mannosidase [Synchytrium microbalum]